MSGDERRTTLSHALTRELGVFGAMMMGLGSIVGTGIFVSIGVAAGVAGPSVVLAIAVAALVAVCNGLSSAQLAANHPVSGGTYEYGYTYAWPLLGFLAGWMFLCAKSASAATAALGFSGYTLTTLGLDAGSGRVGLAVGAVVVLTAVVLSGIRRSNLTNIVIVSITLLTLGLFVAAGLPSAWRNAGETMHPFWASPDTDGWSTPAFLESVALMFVAFTGYGRIATMGEEVRDPHRTIPHAIELTLVVSAALYIVVGAVAVAAAGAAPLAEMTVGRAAPLAQVADGFAWGWTGLVVAVGAVTAMLGVLLNLILGLSRVLLAMGRRGDMPGVTARIDRAGITPYVAVIVVGAVIAGLALIGNVRTTWSFSAFTVLIYYAITNFCALRLRDEQRYYPRWVSAAGLVSCLALAFFVERTFWMAGLGLLALGAVWHLAARRLARGDR